MRNSLVNVFIFSPYCKVPERREYCQSLLAASAPRKPKPKRARTMSRTSATENARRVR